MEPYSHGWQCLQAEALRLLATLIINIPESRREIEAAGAINVLAHLLESSQPNVQVSCNMFNTCYLQGVHNPSLEPGAIGAFNHLAGKPAVRFPYWQERAMHMD